MPSTTLARVIVAGALLLAGGLQGARADALADIDKAKSLRVSIDPAAPPYSAMDQSGNYAGTEVEIAKKLAVDWGVKLEIVATSPANRIPFLVTGKTDVVISTLSITDERRKVVDFTRPYSAIQVVVGVPKASAVNGLPDLVGKRVAVTRGTTNDTELTRAASAGTNIIRFEDDATSITALISGQADAFATAPVLLGTANKQKPGLDMQPRIVLRTNVTGIGVKKGEAALAAKLNQWIDKGLADGSLNTLYKTAFGIDLPPEVTKAEAR